MICSECGSYQPDRAKYCGICGAGLSQDGLVESFLKDKPEHDIVLPRRRSLRFYLAGGLIAILALAILAGAGYLVYRVAWGEPAGKGDGKEVEDNTQTYENQELGFSFSYPDSWILEEGFPAENELAMLTLTLTEKKNMEAHVWQLDPIISIGGIEGIRDYLSEDAQSTIRALGGQPATSEALQPDNGQSGYGQEKPSETANGEEALSGEMGEGSADELFTTTQVSGLPAFYTEFTANVMGEETEMLLYYIVAGDFIFLFQARAPASEYQGIRPQFYSITGSFRWNQILEEQAPDETPGMSTITVPVIIFN